jgi:diguanylate cyclase (GGDEF)-like protein
VVSGPGSELGTASRNSAAAVGLLLSAAVTLVVHVRLRTVDQMSERARLQHDIIDSVDAAMVVLDRSGRIVAANPAWSRLCFQPPAREPDGAPSYLGALLPRTHHGGPELRDALREVLWGRGSIHETDVLCVGDDGIARWFAVKATPLRAAAGGAVVVHTDITARKRTQREAEFLARHDRLTGLMSRAAIEEELDRALARTTPADPHGERVGLLFIDLDGFKGINDVYGHAAGDEVLRVVAQRLRSVVRPTDCIGRLGGDEFVVLLAPLAHPDIIIDTADRLIQVVAQPLPVGERLLGLAASVGIAVARPGEARTDVVHRADHAMYRAKRGGGGRFVASTAV